MNEARLGVAMQGLAQSEVAYQNALIYAKDRLQGRDVPGRAREHFLVGRNRASHEAALTEVRGQFDERQRGLLGI